MGSSGTSKLGPKDKEANFGFGFNNIEFSDRILRLEINIPDEDDNDSECGNDFKVQTLHINSLLFAAKSPFFYKLFSNGMKESQDKDEVTLRITASEEAAFMDMLNSIYDKPLNATSMAELVDVLMAADKFEVACCRRHCIELLVKLPMSLESALFYLELTSSVAVDEVVEPLIDEAKKYLAAHFRDFTKSQQEEAMALPLAAVEAVLGSDGLQVKTEYAVFLFILKWARLHYPVLEERREIVTKRLARFICFPHMSWLKVKEVVDCPDLDSEQVAKLVLNAFFSKDQVLAATAKCSTRLPRRVYGYRLIKVVQLEFARPRCVVFLDFKKQECADLYPSKRLYSQAFCLGGRYLHLYAHRSDNFGLFVATITAGSETCTVDFDFAVVNKSSKEFTSRGKANSCVVTHDGKGWHDLFGMTWAEFMSDDSEYFIDGILHLRAELTLT